MTIKTDSYYTKYTIRLKSHLISVESYRILSRFHVINSSVIVIFKLSEFNHMYFFLYIDIATKILFLASWEFPTWQKITYLINHKYRPCEWRLLRDTNSNKSCIQNLGKTNLVFYKQIARFICYHHSGKWCRSNSMSSCIFLCAIYFGCNLLR